MEINIIDFETKFETNFYNLNIEWLKRFFEVEDYDYEVLSNSKKYIINKGGKIFFAQLNSEIVGTIALMPTSEKNVFELTKMAVKPNYRNNGIGKKLLDKCIEF
jgi:N-acetylglutamate synthase-like GNAT family acetyltransferase